jgi:hypothetical protein
MKERAFMTLIAMISVLIATGSTATGGEIFGTISVLRQSGQSDLKQQPVGTDAIVQITCGNNKKSATTDEYGSYHLMIDTSTSCTLEIQYDGQTMTEPIKVSGERTRWDVRLREVEGKYSIIGRFF